MTLTLSYPESHTYVTFRNLVTVTFNMAVTMGVDFGRYNVNNSLKVAGFVHSAPSNVKYHRVQTPLPIERKVPS